MTEALRVIIVDENLGDSVYEVRDNAVQGSDFEGNSWDHPRVVAFGEAVVVLTKELERLEEEKGTDGKTDPTG